MFSNLPLDIIEINFEAFIIQAACNLSLTKYFSKKNRPLYVYIMMTLFTSVNLADSNSEAPIFVHLVHFFNFVTFLKPKSACKKLRGDSPK
jgi:hypothetical protein